MLKLIRIAEQASTCGRRQVGAIFADGIIPVGLFAANTTLTAYGRCDVEYSGCRRCSDKSIPSGTRLDECVCIHAETNLICAAARLGIATRGLDIWVSCQPCLGCFKLIEASGIGMVHYFEDYGPEYRVPPHKLRKVRP